MRYQKLFNHMLENYDVILLESDMQEICRIAKEIEAEIEAERKEEIIKTKYTRLEREKESATHKRINHKGEIVYYKQIQGKWVYLKKSGVWETSIVISNSNQLTTI